MTKRQIIRLRSIQKDKFPVQIHTVLAYQALYGRLRKNLRPVYTAGKQAVYVKNVENSVESVEKGAGMPSKLPFSGLKTLNRCLHSVL